MLEPQRPSPIGTHHQPVREPNTRSLLALPDLLQSFICWSPRGMICVGSTRAQLPCSFHFTWPLAPNPPGGAVTDICPHTPGVLGVGQHPPTTVRLGQPNTLPGDSPLGCACLGRPRAWRVPGPSCLLHQAVALRPARHEQRWMRPQVGPCASVSLHGSLRKEKSWGLGGKWL